MTGGGHLAALLCAASYGSITTFARLAYEAGGNPATLIVARYALAVLAVGAAVLLLRRRATIDRRHWPALAAVSLGVFGTSLGYLASVRYIPVSLAALIFFTFPIMVAAVGPLLGDGRPTRRSAVMFLVAFAGLALALGPRFDSLDPRGIALALVAAASSATLLLAGRRLAQRYDPLSVTLHVNLLCLSLMLLAWLPLGGIALPQTGSGWAAATTATFAFVAAVTLQFVAVRRIPAADAALALNLEPLVSILATMMLLGERLTTVQWAGVLLVLTALAVAAPRRRDGRERA